MLIHHTLSMMVLIMLITPRMSNAQVPVEHHTPQSLISAYLKALKSADFEAFQSLKWYRRDATWIEEQLKRNGEFDQKRYLQLIEQAVSNIGYDNSSKTSFIASLEKLKLVEWNSWTVKSQSECNQSSTWQCATELTMTILNEAKISTEVSILIKMNLIGRNYYLDQAHVLSIVNQVNSFQDKGKMLYERLGCSVCHSMKQGERKIGPSLYKIYGSTLKSSDGKVRVMNEAHLRDSILSPTTFVVGGYSNGMPSYQSSIKEEDLNALIEYLKTL